MLLATDPRLHDWFREAQGQGDVEVLCEWSSQGTCLARVYFNKVCWPASRPDHHRFTPSPDHDGPAYGPDCVVQSLWGGVFNARPFFADAELAMSPEDIYSYAEGGPEMGRVDTGLVGRSLLQY